MAAGRTGEGDDRRGGGICLQRPCCVHPRRYERLLSGGEVAFTDRCPGLNCLPRKMLRRFGPPRAGHFGLRADVDVAGADSRNGDSCRGVANRSALLNWGGVPETTGPLTSF